MVPAEPQKVKFAAPTLQFPGVVAATRMHLPMGAEIPEATVGHLKKYAQAVEKLGTLAAIAVNSREVEVSAILREAAPKCQIHVLSVPFWGAFVPALNALLGFAQQQDECHYILYHSLETECTPDVLQHLLDHSSPQTLVAGPVLAGHAFADGAQPLNGRSTPWNTLALWSVPKLSLTGFLQVADGMKGGPRRVRSALMLAPEPRQAFMGSEDWWTAADEDQCGMVSCDDAATEVPAGVEEVTAVALLQHLLGQDEALAVLVRLSEALQSQVSWSTSWAGDERRRQWHEYKMSSKIARPAAQLQLLFTKRRRGFCRCRSRTATSKATDGASQAADAQAAEAQHYGVVQHRGPSIRPSFHVEWICNMSILLFTLNFTAVLASAFHELNAKDHSFLRSVCLIGFLIGGVYVPMPLSLFITRMLTRAGDHKAGLVFFAVCLVVSHLCIVLAECFIPQYSLQVCLLARFVQGLGSGIGFQARHILASLSTSEQNLDLQARGAFSAELGLGLGALLPPLLSALVGSEELWAPGPEVPSSAFLALAGLGLLVWICAKFPRRVHVLSDSVRRGPAPRRGWRSEDPASSPQCLAWISGTTRVFVQSAILPVAALTLQDARLTGHFRQSLAVALLCLLPMPFQAAASRLCSSQKPRALAAKAGASRLVPVLLLALAAAALLQCYLAEVGHMLGRIAELLALMMALALAAPWSTARLYQAQDAERSAVRLFWMQAYVGRLLGPVFAIALYHSVGYSTLLMFLCAATGVVCLTA